MTDKAYPKRKRLKNIYNTEIKWKKVSAYKTDTQTYTFLSFPFSFFSNLKNMVYFPLSTLCEREFKKCGKKKKTNCFFFFFFCVKIYIFVFSLSLF